MSLTKCTDDLMMINNHLIECVEGSGPVGPSDKFNPLNLPDNTIRVKYASGVTPTVGDSRTQVDADNNIWDIYKQSNDWTEFFVTSADIHNVLEVLGANTSNVTNMKSMFRYADKLTSVALFNTKNVSDMTNMFQNCTSLTSIPKFYTKNVTIFSRMFNGCTALLEVPLFDTYSATNMENMFSGCSSIKNVPLFKTRVLGSMAGIFDKCYMVESGALALYQQASSQASVPMHGYAFRDCGRDTVTGAAELAQIPSAWK